METLHNPASALDPQNWTEAKQLAHTMVDDMFEHLRTVGQGPVFRTPPAEAISAFDAALPLVPTPAAEVYQQFREQVLPYNTHNSHPRFWAWVQGGGTWQGVMADMLASVMNSNVSLGNHMPMYVENQVIEWSRQMFGFPAGASGILLSGASMANLTALTVARNSFLEGVKQQGLQSFPRQLVVYGSAETHNCVIKAVEVIGVGSAHFRKIEVNEQYEVRIEALRAAIEEDLRRGLQPFCIVGNAGTVNTGATDDLNALAELARSYGLWLHVDGAFGAIPAILPEYAGLREALGKADSLSFDFHKWMYVNYEAACVLIRDREKHRNAFSSAVAYLSHHEEGLSAGPESFANYGIELSRGFKALKVWMSLKHFGLDTYRAAVAKNLQQAQYLASRVAAHPELELLAPVPMNIVCFRFNPGNLNEAALNALNKQLLMQLHVLGIAAPSYTSLNGRYAIRVAHTNHRSREEDFDILVNETVRLGRKLHEAAPAVVTA